MAIKLNYFYAGIAIKFYSMPSISMSQVVKRGFITKFLQINDAAKS